MPNLVNLHGEGRASLASDDNEVTLSLTNTGGSPAIRLSPASNASLAAIVLGSTSFVSAVSIVFAASANWAGLGAIRVKRTDGTDAWIPVLPDAVVTAAAR